MIAIDTNILVYAHREDSPWHEVAFARLAALAESRVAWAIPWPCLHEFLAIVTHPQIYNPPSPLPTALAQVGYNTLYHLRIEEAQWKEACGRGLPCWVRGRSVAISAGCWRARVRRSP
jgi:hypothetical protein